MLCLLHKQNNSKNSKSIPLFSNLTKVIYNNQTRRTKTKPLALSVTPEPNKNSPTNPTSPLISTIHWLIKPFNSALQHPA
jgi:hypothetical protein